MLVIITSSCVRATLCTDNDNKLYKKFACVSQCMIFDDHDCINAA